MDINLRHLKKKGQTIPHEKVPLSLGMSFLVNEVDNLPSALT
jgi:hypothetical protein